MDEFGEIMTETPEEATATGPKELGTARQGAKDCNRYPPTRSSGRVIRRAAGSRTTSLAGTNVQQYRRESRPFANEVERSTHRRPRGEIQDCRSRHDTRNRSFRIRSAVWSSEPSGSRLERCRHRDGTVC